MVSAKFSSKSKWSNFALFAGVMTTGPVIPNLTRFVTHVHSLLNLAIEVVPIGRVVGASDFDLLDVGVDDFVVVAERFDEE